MPGFGDSAFIVILALLLFGPKKLPVLARQSGKLMADFRRASNEFRSQMEEELRISEQADRRGSRRPRSCQRRRDAPAPPSPIRRQTHRTSPPQPKVRSRRTLQLVSRRRHALPGGPHPSPMISTGLMPFSRIPANPRPHPNQHRSPGPRRCRRAHAAERGFRLHVRRGPHPVK